MREISNQSVVYRRLIEGTDSPNEQVLGDHFTMYGSGTVVEDPILTILKFPERKLDLNTGIVIYDYNDFGRYEIPRKMMRRNNGVHGMTPYRYGVFRARVDDRLDDAVDFMTRNFTFLTKFP